MRTGNCDRLKKTQTLFYGGNMKKIALITYFPPCYPHKGCQLCRAGKRTVEEGKYFCQYGRLDIQNSKDPIIEFWMFS